MTRTFVTVYLVCSVHEAISMNDFRVRAPLNHVSKSQFTNMLLIKLTVHWPSVIIIVNQSLIYI